jgi:hypothetical protein
LPNRRARAQVAVKLWNEAKREGKAKAREKWKAPPKRGFLLVLKPAPRRVDRRVG